MVSVRYWIHGLLLFVGCGDDSATGPGATVGAQESTSQPDETGATDIADPADTACTLPESLGFTDGDPVEILIENRSATAQFVVDPGCLERPFEIELPDGVEGFAPAPCGLPCGEAAQGSQCICEGCRNLVWRIEPGAVLTTQWNGLVSHTIQLPAEGCYCSEFVQTCHDNQHPDAGTYSAVVQVITADECSGDCTVPCPDGGACELGSALDSAAPVAIATSFAQPGATSVTVQLP